MTILKIESLKNITFGIMWSFKKIDNYKRKNIVQYNEENDRKIVNNYILME